MCQRHMKQVNAHFVLLTCESYKSLGNLHVTEATQKAVRKIMECRGFKVHLIDDYTFKQGAQAILRKLRDIDSQVKRRDQVLLYVSGHQFHIMHNDNREKCLCLYDAPFADKAKHVHGKDFLVLSELVACFKSRVGAIYDGCNKKQEVVLPKDIRLKNPEFFISVVQWGETTYGQHSLAQFITQMQKFRVLDWRNLIDQWFGSAFLTPVMVEPMGCHPPFWLWKPTSVYPTEVYVVKTSDWNQSFKEAAGSGAQALIDLDAENFSYTNHMLSDEVENKKETEDESDDSDESDESDDSEEEYGNKKSKVRKSVKENKEKEKKKPKKASKEDLEKTKKRKKVFGKSDISHATREVEEKGADGSSSEASESESGREKALCKVPSEHEEEREEGGEKQIEVNLVAEAPKKAKRGLKKDELVLETVPKGAILTWGHFDFDNTCLTRTKWMKFFILMSGCKGVKNMQNLHDKKQELSKVAVDLDKLANLPRNKLVEFQTVTPFHTQPKKAKEVIENINKALIGIQLIGEIQEI